MTPRDGLGYTFSRETAATNSYANDYYGSVERFYVKSELVLVGDDIGDVAKGLLGHVEDGYAS